jgi:hypothetical protein
MTFTPSDSNTVSSAEILGLMNTLPDRIAAADEAIRPKWDDQMRFDGVGVDTPYVAMGVLARVIYDQSTEHGVDLRDVFAAIEAELVSADGTARNLLIVGLLEGLQNVSLNRGRAVDTWVRWMGPATLAGWRMVERLWDGSISPADFNAFVDAQTGDIAGH